MIAAAEKEYPILFSPLMVRAILEGRKTQTRRIIKPRKKTEPLPQALVPWVVMGERQLDDQGRPCWMGSHYGYGSGTKWFSCPYGQTGDRLWVKETYQRHDGELIYRADAATGLGKKPPGDGVAPWKSSMFMPKDAARIWLEILDVRVEQLQSISESDAQAEGVDRVGDGWKCYGNCKDHSQGYDKRTSATASFMSLWDSINGKTCPWDSNPWVWVISFRRIQP